MKSFIVAACIVACVFAANHDAQVLRSENVQTPEGNFQYSFETDNGISGLAQGNVKVFGKDEVALEIKGSNSFKSPEGETFSLTYIADENGYQPQGDHLPTPPPPQEIPVYIQRSLEYIAAHPYTEKN